MPSGVERPAEAPDGVVEIAQRLCGAGVLTAQTCAGGGNNRVYRIRTADKTYAMKCYGASDFDERDRLGHEFDGLRFLNDNGVGSMLPAALAVDRAARCALYEWVDGTAVVNHGTQDIAALLDLLAALHTARNADRAAALPVATEAVLRLSDLLVQIEARLERLNAVAPAEPDLAVFIAMELQPELERRVTRLHGWDVNAELEASQRTLSPSDLGFHNALRRPDGSLAFIDFEYFGWDDPVKLTADFLWHPAMQLSERERRQFLNGAMRLYGDDMDFAGRLNVYFPLYGIRWTLIILNEFLPQIWERRSFSGKGGDQHTAKRAQLLKARSKMAALRAYSEGEFFV